MSQQNMADMQEIEIFTSAFAGKFGTSLKNRKQRNEKREAWNFTKNKRLKPFNYIKGYFRSARINLNTTVQEKTLDKCTFH